MATMSEFQVDDFTSRLEVEPGTGSVRQVKGDGGGSLAVICRKRLFKKQTFLTSHLKKFLNCLSQGLRVLVPSGLRGCTSSVNIPCLLHWQVGCEQLEGPCCPLLLQLGECSGLTWKAAGAVSLPSVPSVGERIVPEIRFPVAWLFIS